MRSRRFSLSLCYCCFDFLLFFHIAIRTTNFLGYILALLAHNKEWSVSLVFRFPCSISHPTCNISCSLQNFSLSRRCRTCIYSIFISHLLLFAVVARAPFGSCLFSCRMFFSSSTFGCIFCNFHQWNVEQCEHAVYFATLTNGFYRYANICFNIISQRSL